ncbi:MAG: hypothetical protein P8P30_04945 [Rickettsiales bacterium]|nr:hypothetical protein [Rickettsiales bacterium]
MPAFFFPFILLLPVEAYAYIDPATGGLLVQIIIGAVVTAIATGKLWWYRLMNLFGNKDTPPSKESKASADPKLDE